MMPAILQAQSHFYHLQSSGLHLIKIKAHSISYETESLNKLKITGRRGKFTPLLTMKLYEDDCINTLKSLQTSFSVGFQNNHLIKRWKHKYLSFILPTSSNQFNFIISHKSFYLFPLKLKPHLVI